MTIIKSTSTSISSSISLLSSHSSSPYDSLLHPLSFFSIANLIFRSKFYLLSFLLRFLLCFLPLSIIHPDEFHQSTDPGAHFLLSSHTELTWEWTSNQPVRNILFPLFVSFPFTLLSNLSNLYHVGIAIFVCGRLTMFILSILSDIMVVRLYNNVSLLLHSCTPDLSSLYFYFYSWPVLIMVTRPFSNVIEGFLVLWLLQIILLPYLQYHIRLNINKKSDINSSLPTPCISHKDAIIIGILISIGTFTRITILIFALPIMMFILYSFYTSNVHPFYPILRIGTSILISFLLISCLLILIDSIFYSHLHGLNGYSLYFTPLNFLLYNISTSNVSNHGLHPYYLHILVNLPMMFGPILFHFLIGKHSSIQYSSNPIAALYYLLCSSIILPLVFLSFIPHQEPRFLFPLLYPLVLLLPNKNKISNVPISIIFTVILTLFWGILHQGGIISSLLYLSSITHKNIELNKCTNTSIIYWQTYMPPCSLLGWVEGETTAIESTCKWEINDREGHTFVYELFDWHDHNVTDIYDSINLLMKNQTEKDESSCIHLVMPAAVSKTINLSDLIYLNNINKKRKTWHWDCSGQPNSLSTENHEIIHFYPHLSTEHLPSLGAFRLDINCLYFS